jgi:hypothetical protein
MNFQIITQKAFIDELNKLASDVGRFAKMWIGEASGALKKGSTMAESNRALATLKKGSTGILSNKPKVPSTNFGQSSSTLYKIHE